MEQLQSHIWLTDFSYMGKYLRISSHIRKPFLLIYDFATAPLWISFYMMKIWFSFYQCILCMHQCICYGDRCFTAERGFLRNYWATSSPLPEVELRFCPWLLKYWGWSDLRSSLHRVPTPTPLSSTLGKAGRNHLAEEITPLLPTGMDRRAIQPNHIKFSLGHAALLRRC